MQKKFIAALLMSVLVSWAQSLALAVQEPAKIPTAAATASIPSPHHHDAHAGKHACCPRLHSQILAEISPGAMPCGDQHRCCMTQGTDLPATLPLGSETSRSGGDLGDTAILFDARWAAANSIPSVAVANAFRPYTAFSTILRI